MSKSYKVLVSVAAVDMFEDALDKYMKILKFRRNKVGGRLGSRGTLVYKKDDNLLSLIAKDQRHSKVEMIVHSEQMDVEALVQDVITEGLADFIMPFCDGLKDPATLDQVITNLRNAFTQPSAIDSNPK